MALRRANRKFTRVSVGGMWPSGLAGKMLCWPLAAMRLCRECTCVGVRPIGLCGVQTVSSRAAQWSGMWPSGLAGKMLCWPLAAMRLYRGKTDWPLRCANRKFTHGSVERHVALWVGRQNAVLAVGRNAPVPGKDRLALRRANRKFTRGSVGGMWPAAFAPS